MQLYMFTFFEFVMFSLDVSFPILRRIRPVRLRRPPGIIVAMKCLNLVPDLAAWMIPEGETAFSTRNFGEGVAQQAKMSAQGMIGKVL